MCCSVPFYVRALILHKKGVIIIKKTPSDFGRWVNRFSLSYGFISPLPPRNVVSTMTVKFIGDSAATGET